MWSGLPGHGRGTLVAGAVLLAAIAGHQIAAAGAVARERGGPFESCLESRLEQWTATQAELVVNEDPNARPLDDAAVASWTAEAVGACRSQAGSGEELSVHLFIKYMARWREHIYHVVENIRRRTQPD